MIRYLIFALLFCASVTTVRAHIEIKDCGSTAGKFDKVEIPGCDLLATSCELKKGSNASIELHFIPNKTASLVKVMVHGIVEDLDLPFPVPDADACEDPESMITCPLIEGAETSYHATFPVLVIYPTVTLTVRWELRDQDDESLVCVEIPVSIK